MTKPTLHPATDSVDAAGAAADVVPAAANAAALAASYLTFMVIVWLPHVLWHNVGHPGNCPPCPRCGFESERKTLKMAPPRNLFHLFSIIYTQIVRVFFQRGNCIF